MRIVDLLAKKIPAKLLPLVPRSYDLVGSIAIVEIRTELKKYEKAIAQAILHIQKPIRTVAKKTSAMQGRFRVRKLKIIAGEKSTETLYKEHDCTMKLDVAKTYFSIRLSHERERIANLVKEKENVLIMFAGVGPFALVIAKKHPKAKVTGIELNPVATRYFKENIELNKLQNCSAIRGDVKKIVPRLMTQCSMPNADRILMPLPKGAADFLDAAFVAAKNGCVVHFYQFAPGGNPFAEAEERITEAARKAKAKVKILNEVIVRPYAPRIVQVCIDFKIRK